MQTKYTTGHSIKLPGGGKISLTSRGLWRVQFPSLPPVSVRLRLTRFVPSLPQVSTETLVHPFKYRFELVYT